MQAYLVRIGIDQTFGQWNAPVDPATGEFVYIPIPESAKEFQPDCQRTYNEFLPALQAFCAPRKLDLFDDLRFSAHTAHPAIHLDPDFSHLTYGDDGDARGKAISTLAPNDIVAFYAGLKPISKCPHKLLYSLVGLYVVDSVTSVSKIPADRWHENAHTRKKNHHDADIVVRAKPDISGRLAWSLPIGEFRSGAYRVRHDLLAAWGGLSVKDGFLQRSFVPPQFSDPEKFLAWFAGHNIPLLASNF